MTKKNKTATKHTKTHRIVVEIDDSTLCQLRWQLAATQAHMIAGLATPTLFARVAAVLCAAVSRGDSEVKDRPRNAVSRRRCSDGGMMFCTPMLIHSFVNGLETSSRPGISRLGRFGNGTSETSNRPRSSTSHRYTSSPESAAGRSRFGWRGGRKVRRFGPVLVRASRSRSRVANLEQMTLDIFGRYGSISSRSAALQSSLESKLRRLLAGRGSPLYEMTWKRWGMPSGPPICALRASARRTSDSGSGSARSGWPTPTANDATGSDYAYSGGDRRRVVLKLTGVARLIGFNATTGWRGQLNPAFVRWLMGYPAAWDAFAPTAMQSSRRSRRRS
ncbi:MAG: hypothetical protein KatS3mg082_1413 [Nitrospiraceae bacterium]|nr:MAG: hypothetical protein KatS3mg082_1413 [Nitrospiraceae bacterium]